MGETLGAKHMIGTIVGLALVALALIGLACLIYDITRFVIRRVHAVVEYFRPDPIEAILFDD